MDVSEPNTSSSGQGQSTPGETAGTTEVVTVDQKKIMVKENLSNVFKCFSNKALKKTQSLHTFVQYKHSSNCCRNSHLSKLWR